jgi:hypothetical protein
MKKILFHRYEVVVGLLLLSLGTIVGSTLFPAIPYSLGEVSIGILGIGLALVSVPQMPEKGISWSTTRLLVVLPSVTFGVMACVAPLIEGPRLYGIFMLLCLSLMGAAGGFIVLCAQRGYAFVSFLPRSEDGDALGDALENFLESPLWRFVFGVCSIIAAFILIGALWLLLSSTPTELWSVVEDSGAEAPMVLYLLPALMLPGASLAILID